MADVVLSDGREITLDMYQVKRREYRALFDNSQAPEDESEIIGRASGLTAEQVDDLPMPDWRALVVAFFAKAREPLTDPKSARPSISA